MKKIIKLGSMLAIATPIVAVISCNVSFERQIKNDHLSKEVLFENQNSKDLIKMIKTNYEYQVLMDTWAKYIENAKYDDTAQKFVDDGGKTKSPIASSLSSESITANWSATTDSAPYWFLRSVEYKIWRNTLINQDIRSLLNNIKTVYNRYKNVYPTSSQIIYSSKYNIANIKYQVDLVSNMKRRFMDRYIDLDVNIPMIGATDDNFKKVFNFDDPLSDAKSIFVVLNQIINNPTNIRGFDLNGWFKNTKIMNGSIIDTHSLKFSVINNKYVVQYDVLNNFNVADNGDGYELTFDRTTNNLPKEFSKEDDLDTVAAYVKDQLFESSSNDYIKNLFENENGLNVNIQFVSLAGTTIGGLTIDDYIKNIATSNLPDSKNTRDFGKMDIFFTGKKDNSISWYQTGISFTSDGKVVT